jgi:fucose 4-O-acetylase-like acetyltransferase
MHKQVPLIDWFKATGIFLIVLGHTNGHLKGVEIDVAK